MLTAPRTIALMNQKGGVGKTTTVVNLGAALAERGRRVLLIDLDPQAHLTITYGVDPDDPQHAATLYEVMIGEAGLLQGRAPSSTSATCPARSTCSPAASIWPASKRNSPRPKAASSASATRWPQADHDYDYVLLDCPPSLGLLTVNALAMAGEVVIPMQAHFLALQGFREAARNHAARRPERQSRPRASPA